MSQLALVRPSFRAPPSAATQWAHDIRNILATVGLHLDTLERLAGTRGHRAVEAAHALMTRATAMCDQTLTQARTEPPARRRAVDVVKTIRQVTDLLDPIAPEGFAIRIHAEDAAPVLADPEQVFRILFNLLHNAVTLARRHNAITAVDITVVRRDATVTVRIADDGPGLPAAVRRNLFRPGASETGAGIGLAIARELAERNGGVLELAQSRKGSKLGTTFALELPVAPTLVAAVGLDAVTRSLGQRVLSR
jgi:signal transduction histidine kinase